MELIDCNAKGTSTNWTNNEGAKACLNSKSGPFPYGIYEKAVPLTIETDLLNKYVYALFWGFQVCIWSFIFFPQLKLYAFCV
jgi:cyclic nucleotide gated channel